MIRKSLGIVSFFFTLSLTAKADIVVVAPGAEPCDPYGHHGSASCGQTPTKRDCEAYNRDGITCEQVGFYEGQVGYPWGYQSGQFRCVNGCLAWAGQSNNCYAYNRDGVSCSQVGFHEGQVGYPWGFHSGKFRCVDSCLQYVWWW